eukprot:CAMPEP_0196756666 /NCGR_PEP_ID=MMETSP1091-20130531/101821_1 /TAXON_ID=302021 /ORGANISM="Rhodomonas sp., Strain CCMP768" /LENGTH=64 /DNA_ID=CAMNT_0042105323 /DNA_START=253 /DNA_END=444 /DNA_ORIENTATION=-
MRTRAYDREDIELCEDQRRQAAQHARMSIDDAVALAQAVHLALLSAVVHDMASGTARFSSLCFH